jgi:hypothetical protein
VKIALLGDTGAQNNLGAVIVKLNRAVNGHLGIGTDERADLGSDRFEAALADLPALADQVRDEVREALR